MAELDRKFAAVLHGETEPLGAIERLSLASFCRQPSKRLYRTATRFYAEGFAADPKFAADLTSGHRYNAACCAALAAAGQGEDTRALPDKVVCGLRRQALGWLRADLTQYAKTTERGEPAAKQTVRQRLAHWRQGPALASVRDRVSLDRLPEAERQAWRQLWADVDALLKKVTPAGPPP